MQAKLNNTNNPEWQEAHRINQKNKPRTVLKNFDTEITAKEREGFEYDPFKYLEQTNWIKETFYKVSNPNGNIQLKRQFINGDPDDFIIKRTKEALASAKARGFKLGGARPNQKARHDAVKKDATIEQRMQNQL